jgi:signal transduction histidine kinase
MKLQTQTNFYNVIYTGVILVIVGFFLQLTLVKIYYRQIDDSIITERQIIENEIEDVDTIPDYSAIFNHQIEVSLLSEPVKYKNTFVNLVKFNDRTQTDEPYRQHSFAQNRENGLGYTITILKPMSELRKFKQVVMVSISLTFLLLLIVFLGSGYFVNRRLWRPFYETLDRLNQFNLDAPETLKFTETNINEFRQLNENISSLSKKLKRDYVRMKEFTENLSHEINTMLAIIVSKVELLLQKEDMTEEQVEHFKTIYQVTFNLSHLNNGLLLLAKIDNRYYSETEDVELSGLIMGHLKTFDDFIKQKELKVETRMAKVTLTMNKSLANILTSNIVVNAIKHNCDKGFITIILNETTLTVENPGDNSQAAQSELIENIQNHYKPVKSLGLGMEIIKRICRIYNYSMSHSNDDGIYRVEIQF